MFTAVQNKSHIKTCKRPRGFQNKILYFKKKKKKETYYALHTSGQFTFYETKRKGLMWGPSNLKIRSKGLCSCYSWVYSLTSKTVEGTCCKLSGMTTKTLRWMWTRRLIYASDLTGLNAVSEWTFTVSPNTDWMEANSAMFVSPVAHGGAVDCAEKAIIKSVDYGLLHKASAF